MAIIGADLKSMTRRSSGAGMRSEFIARLHPLLIKIRRKNVDRLKTSEYIPFGRYQADIRAGYIGFKLSSIEIKLISEARYFVFGVKLKPRMWLITISTKNVYNKKPDADSWLTNYMFLALSWQFVCFVAGSKVKDISATVTRQIRSLGFPQGSGMGIFFAIGIPVDIPDKSVTFSFYFEANYLLPDRLSVAETELEETFSKRSLNRSLAYEVIQRKLDGAGYPGRSCLLRTICEASMIPVTNNGLLGDIIHILFTPSTSTNEDLPSEITGAENSEDCETLYSDCPISLLDLISHYEKNKQDDIM